MTYHKQVQKKCEDFEVLSKELDNLKSQYNELIESCIPQVWENGDVRPLNSVLFNRLIILKTKMINIQFKIDACFNVPSNLVEDLSSLIYVGRYGQLHLVNSNN